MNKVTAINLGGRAYQLEETGYDLLTDYFRQAGERLANDPDKNEIISDLERAVAEKFDHLLPGGKTVILQSEVENIIKEMGQVESSGKVKVDNDSAEEDPHKKFKRLYRLSEEKVIAGVCAGLAAYFNMDVVLVRVIFVVLAFLTQGAMILVYLIMIIVVPKARTPEEISAAYGGSLTAQELAERVREEFSQAMNSNGWKRKRQEWKKRREEWREKRREMRREWRQYGQCQGSVFGALLKAAFIVFWIIGLISIITSGIVFGFIIPAAWPIWAVIVGWVLIFPAISGALSGTCCFNQCRGSGVFSLLWLVFIAWLIWYFFPGSHYYFQQAGQAIEHAWEAIKNG